MARAPGHAPPPWPNRRWGGQPWRRPRASPPLCAVCPSTASVPLNSLGRLHQQGFASKAVPRAYVVRGCIQEREWSHRETGPLEVGWAHAMMVRRARSPMDCAPTARLNICSSFSSTGGALGGGGSGREGGGGGRVLLANTNTCGAPWAADAADAAAAVAAAPACLAASFALAAFLATAGLAGRAGFAACGGVFARFLGFGFEAGGGEFAIALHARARSTMHSTDARIVGTTSVSRPATALGHEPAEPTL